MKEIILGFLLLVTALPASSQPTSHARKYENLLNLIRQDKYDQAFSALGELREKTDNLKPDKRYVKFMLDVIYLLNQKGNYEPALTYCFYLLELCGTNENLSFEKTECLLEIGSAYYFLGLPTLSLNYTNQAMALSLQNGYKKQYASAVNKVGLYYETMGYYDSAISEFEKGLELRKGINDIHGQSGAIGNLGLAQAKLGHYDDALASLLKSLALDESIQDTLGVAWSHQMLGLLSTEMSNYTEATNYLNLAEIQARRVKSAELLLQTYWSKKELLEKLGQFEEALEYSNRYEQLRDSIHDIASLGRTALLQGNYELSQKTKEIASQRITLTWQRNFILLGIAVAFIISVLASFYYRSFRAVKALNLEIAERNEEILQQTESLTKANVALAKLNGETAEQKEEIQAQAEELTESHQTIVKINEQLEETVNERTTALAQAYKELDTFFYRASHDFRRPLTTFMGLAEVSKIMVKDPYALDLFDKVRQTAQNLDKMLMKLQSISDVGLQQLSYKEVFSEDIFNIIFTSHGEDFRNAEINYKTEAKIDSFYSYPTIVRVILENLVENAIQFRGPENAFVKLAIYEQDNEVVLAVSDNGQGIDEQYHGQIFNMYFRGSENSKGNGLGLYIVKKATEKLKGRISFKSTFAQGSTFFVSLPKRIP